MEGILYCNNKKCHRPFTSDSDAWLTSCFHIFCKEHFPSGPASLRKCPRCSKDLPEKYDVCIKNLNPPVPYMLVVLSGFSPSNILETGFKALKFLSFQSFYEKRFLQTYIKHQQLKMANSEVQQIGKEAFYQETIDELKSLIQKQTKDCENLKREWNNALMKTQHLEAKLQNSNRMLQKIRLKYGSAQKQPSHHFDLVDQPRNLSRRGSFSFEPRHQTENGSNRLFCSQQAPVSSSENCHMIIHLLKICHRDFPSEINTVVNLLSEVFIETLHQACVS